MNVVPFPATPSSGSVHSSLRALAERAPDWCFSCVAGGAEGVQAISHRTGDAIYARWTGSDWVVLSAEPAVIGRACNLLSAFEQALSL
jgi:hypothetical protein